MVILTHTLNYRELNGFFWLNDYGWCFDWYENKELEKADCLTYGLFPSDFIDSGEEYEDKVKAFLQTQSKEDEPKAEDFHKWNNSL